MKKFIKEYLTYLMSIAVLLTSMPFGVLAAGVPVEVNINGVASIEYVATINAPIDININESNKGLGYILVNNNSNVYLKAKVSDIVATSEDAPSNFVAADAKDWSSLSAEDTKKYIAFEIAGSKYTIENKNTSKTDVYQKKCILYSAGTENYKGVELGVLSSDACEDCGPVENENIDYAICVLADQKIYTLEATVGYKWEKNAKLSYNVIILTESLGTKEETYVGYDSETATLNGHCLNFKLKDSVGSASISLNKSGETANPTFNGNLYIATDGTQDILRLSGGKTTLAEAPKSDYEIIYSWNAKFGWERVKLAFEALSFDNGISIYASNFKETFVDEGGLDLDNEFTDAINNYKAGDVVYVPYTVRINHTNSSSNKVDMTYTYEDIMLVYILD